MANPSTQAPYRFTIAVERIIKGARLQRDRLAQRDTEKTRPLLPYSAESRQIIDLTGEDGHDLDYYVYELGRLQDAAREIIKRFHEPDDVVAALDTFDQAIPYLREARNPLTHPSDDSRLDNVAFVGAVMKLGPNGSVQYLVDPRHRHHEAAEALAKELLDYLRSQKGD